ncbi:AmiS/UreI family transporter [Alcaligenes sp. SDU_A2]|uniref:AmiS/UreI family transporter n=1 Tax=Alcaligenes sp. SDU_A2 TaxID=3136634 RepID=UPI002C92BD83|nr:AmiS/UreI family transporter [Alcaligenes sp.]HRL26451.1 AmiS/UreI family transporter [Alcaligenes sp.]
MLVIAFLAFAGLCLFVNGVRLYYSQGHAPTRIVDAKDAAIVNLFTAALGLICMAHILNPANSATYSPLSAIYLGLFALTYFWVGISAFTGSDGRALGWYSLLVACIAVPAAITSLLTARTVFDYWQVVSWLSWAVLWFMFFLLLVLDKPIARVTGLVSAVQGVLTALLPALLYFWGLI